MNKHVEDLLARRPELAPCAVDVADVCGAVIDCFERGGKLLLCGNGGSAADCEHIAGELLKGFLKKRPVPADECPSLDEETLGKLQMGLPVVPLTGFPAFNSAFCNDADPDLVYAQLTLALGRPGDILFCISTSGNAQNVVAAARVARSRGLAVVALTGASGGALAPLADVAVTVPADRTHLAQELHLPVYHCICAAVEEHFFKE